MDLQFTAEASLAIAHYVSGYVTKAEKSNIQELWQEIGENRSLYSRLWSFGVRSLRSRECGLYEASDLLLGHHLMEKSEAVQWVKVGMPHKRNRRLKKHKELTAMVQGNPDCDEIFEENLVDTHCPQRPCAMASVCLYDFVALYVFDGRDRNGERQYRRRLTPQLVNHMAFDPEKEDQRESYYYSLVLLFVPFREESCLLEESETAEQAFNRLLPGDSNCSTHHSRLQTMLAAKVSVTAINKARDADGMEEKIDMTDDDQPQLLGEARSAMKDVADMAVKQTSTLSLEERMAMLNVDQRRVFDNIKAHLLHQEQHDSKSCSCDFTPLRMFVSGVGGTGKSFLIETIDQLTSKIWPSGGTTCAIAAPTGLAAFNVGGMTLHRLFQLPIEHEGKTSMYWPLPKASHKVMKTTLHDMKLLIVDEVSMVSSLTLAYVHLRLEEIFGEQEWFGSKNVLFVGDLLQLQPVNGQPVFEKVSSKAVTLKLGCATSVNIWRDTVVYDELTINERQSNDLEFSTMLDSVRRGYPTDDTLNTLQKRVFSMPVADKFAELQRCGQTPVCLFPKRKACAAFNSEMLSSLPSKVHTLVCADEVDETASTRKWSKKAADQLEKLNEDCNRTAGLEAKLELAVGARVMLRRNIDIKAGLVNGAIGTVCSVSSSCVTVQFDHIAEPYDVQQVKSKFMLMKSFYVYRKQFPLILAYAVTIHKCQGLSLDSAIIDLSDQVFAAGMAYVALSRVRSLSGLHLLALDRKAFSISVPSLKEVNRLRETFRKDLKLYSIPQRPVDRKRKLTGCVQQYEPKTKKPRLAMAGKRKAAFDSAGQPLAKKLALQQPVPGKRKLAFDSAGQPPAKKPALEEPGKKPGSHTMDRGDLRTPPHSGSILLTCSGNGMPVPPLGSALRSLTE